jgi:hypothetical protein
MSFVQQLTRYSDETTTLKSQVAELYKIQNAHLQQINTLEAGLTSLQQAETLLKQECGTTVCKLT